MRRTIACLSTLAALAATGAGVAPALAADSLAFQTPSGNIHCLLDDGDWRGLRCDIMEFTPNYSDPRCDLDFGYAFGLEERGAGYPLCAGDTIRNDRAFVLQYGRQLSLGAFTCLSGRDGLTCHNGDAHGIFLSRARQRAF